jgi:beta-N-acetylhexosaminidase
VAYLKSDIESLFENEFVPFRAGIEEGADGIMAAHIVVRAQDAETLPATISPALLTGVLREALAFDGLIITDSLTMRALDGVPRPAVSAIEAGADIVLKPKDPYLVREQILSAIEEGTLTIERIDESVLRIIRVKIKRGTGRLPPGDPAPILGNEEHRRIAGSVSMLDQSLR